MPGKAKEKGKEERGKNVESKSRAHASLVSRHMILYGGGNF